MTTGFLTRALVPRSVRRATHPVRTVRRAATPKTVKKARRALHPVDNAVYSATRALNTKARKKRNREHLQPVANAASNWYQNRFNTNSQGLQMSATPRRAELYPDDSCVVSVTGRITRSESAVAAGREDGEAYVDAKIRVSEDQLTLEDESDDLSSGTA